MSRPIPTQGYGHKSSYTQVVISTWNFPVESEATAEKPYRYTWHDVYRKWSSLSAAVLQRSLGHIVKALLSRTRIADNFMNVFNVVISPRVFSYCSVLFRNNASGLYFKIIYGLKPQVSGIKVSTDDPFSKLAHSHFLIGIAQTSTWWLLKLTDCGKKKAIFGVPSILITWRCHSMISTIVIYGNGYSTRKKSMFLLAILGVYPALKWKNPKDDYAYSVN